MVNEVHKMISHSLFYIVMILQKFCTRLQVVSWGRVLALLAIIVVSYRYSDCVKLIGSK